MKNLRKAESFPEGAAVVPGSPLQCEQGMGAPENRWPQMGPDHLNPAMARQSRNASGAFGRRNILSFSHDLGGCLFIYLIPRRSG